jgi:hypothetical protein
MKHNAAIMAMPAASPSMLSMKFTALTMTTIQITVMMMLSTSPDRDDTIALRDPFAG